MQNAFKELRAVIFAASACTKPDAKSFGSLLEPLGKEVSNITQVPEKNRKERTWFNHLQVVSEGAPSLGWVQIVSNVTSFCLLSVQVEF